MRPLSALGEDLPIRTIAMTKKDKSCFPEIQVGTCSATIKVGWSIEGHNEGGKHNNIKTYKECLEMCCKDLNCKSFDYGGDNSQCCLSHTTMDKVDQASRDENSGPTWSYSEMTISRPPAKTAKGKKRVAFRTEGGGYLAVDQQGWLTCNSITLEENAIFDLIRPIETGH